MSLLSGWTGLALLALLAPAAGVAEPGAALAPPTEYEVKAAYLYNFAKFIEWPPATAHGEFVIGVLGQDPFGETLDRVLRGKALGDRKIVNRATLRNVARAQSPGTGVCCASICVACAAVKWAGQAS